MERVVAVELLFVRSLSWPWMTRALIGVSLVLSVPWNCFGSLRSVPEGCSSDWFPQRYASCAPLVVLCQIMLDASMLIGRSPLS